MRTIRWLILAFCLLSFVRGVHELGAQSLWWDESLSHYRATRPIPFILSNRIDVRSWDAEVPTTDNHPPLYFILLHLVVSAAGDSEFALRFLSMGSGVLLIPLLYLCGKRLFGPPSGALAALLGALSPLYLWYQQEARPYVLVTLFGAASFYALLRLLQVKTRPEQRGQAVEAAPPPSSPPAFQPFTSFRAGSSNLPAFQPWSALYVLSVAAMLATNYFSFFLLAAEGIILLLSWGRHRRRLSWVMAAVGAVAAVLFTWGVRAMPRQADLPGFDFLPLPTLLRDVFHAFTLGLSGDTLVLFRWAGIGLFILAIPVLFAGRRRVPWPHAAYLLLCFLLPVGEMFLLSLVRPAYLGVRHLMFASPFYYLLLAAGVSAMLCIASPARHIHLRPSPPTLGADHSPHFPFFPFPLFPPLTSLARALAGIGLGLVLAGMLASMHAYWTDPQYTKEDHRGWGAYLSRHIRSGDHIRPGDVVIVNSGFISELYTYYVQSQAPWYGLPVRHASPDETVRRLEALTAQVDRVWVAYSSTPGWATADNIVLKWLETHTTRIAFAQFDSPSTVVRAYAFRRQPPLLDALPGTASPLALNLDDQLHLLGRGWSTGRVPAGHVLQLSLYWSAARPLDRDYRVTLSLSDEAGFSWAAADYAPCHGTYPARQWPAGQIVRDDVDLSVPPGVPPGRYQLNVSAYPADKGSPALPVRDMENGVLRGLIVPIGEVQVVQPDQPASANELPIPQRVRYCHGGLALLGHDHSGGTYRPGDVLLINMYWKALRAPGRDLAFSIKLLGADGETWGSQAIVPSRTYPSSQWEQGEVVWGQYRFRIPIDTPEGAYRFSLTPLSANPDPPGADHSDSRPRPRLRWPWEARGVTLGTLTVLPAAGDRSFEIPPMQHTLRANLDDQVELLGYDLASETVRPGEVVSCTLYWRAQQEIEQDYTVFNHLVGADGQRWGQWDNQPQRGRLPTTRWVPGQVVADPYQIPVAADAPPRPLQLWAGMYDARTMARLSVRDEDGQATGDQILVTEIQVVPK